MKQDSKELPAAFQGLGYHELNAMLNLYGQLGEWMLNGQIRDADVPGLIGSVAAVVSQPA